MGTQPGGVLGELITTSEIAHISPLAHQHIHLYGHYSLRSGAEREPGGENLLRRLLADSEVFVLAQHSLEQSHTT